MANAGGLNPAGLAARLSELAEKLGLTARIAYLTGDDLTPRLGDLQAGGQLFTHADTGMPLAAADRPVVTANAYWAAGVSPPPWPRARMWSSAPG